MKSKQLTAWFLSAMLVLPSAGYAHADVSLNPESGEWKLENQEAEKSTDSNAKESDSNAKKDDTSKDDVNKVTDSDADKKDSAWDDLYAEANGKGALEVLIGNALPLQKKLQVRITLRNSDEKVVAEKTITLEPGTTSRETVLENLLRGTYTMTITAPGFADYEQEIDIDGDIKRAEIYSGKVNVDGVSYDEGTPHPGLLLVGDVDGDGEITEDDKDALLDAMSDIKSETLLERIIGKISQKNADLNGDGTVDIVDLQYYANSMNDLENGIDTKASISSRISEKTAKVAAAEGTKAEGNLQNLLSDTGSVVLKTADGKDISEENPVEIGIGIQSKAQEEEKIAVPVERIEITTGENGIENGEVLLETEDGDLVPFVIKNGTVVSAAAGIAMFAAFGMDDVSAQGQAETPSNRLVIDLGGQIAVKRVIIRITSSTHGNSLVDISKVEFLNDMENRIPAPEMDIPKNLQAAGANKSFTLTWDQSKNVTGYEVEISYKGEKEVIRVATNTLKVSSFQKEELVNKEVYAVRVQAVNGAWSSGYGATVNAVPKLAGRPDAPDYLKANGGYKKIQVSWKDMDDTDSYFVYWREKGTETYSKSGALKKTSFEINDLKDKTTYEVYVTGVNELGESDPSLISEATTTIVRPAVLPEYKMLNEPNGTGELTSHIVSATHPRGEMIGSKLDEGSKDSALGLFDNDYSSYYYMGDWDEGGVYPASNKGIYVTFDGEYKMNYIMFAEVEDSGSYNGGSLYYYDPDGTEHKANVASVVQKTDANGRKYYMMKLAQPITTGKVRIGFTRYGGWRNITLAEIRFYHYDSMEDDVMALYADDLHTKLKTDVTLATIEALQNRLDTPEEKSGELHPEYDAIKKEIDNAKGLLDASLREAMTINPQITAAKDGHLGFSGLNAWQPLGVSAYAGERVVIYVGHNTKKTGENTNIKLVATQYHGESGSVKTDVASLKVGRNEVTIPSLQSLAAEKGGALYIEYTGNNENDRYAVRVSGGTKIPVLNLYGVKDEAERKAKVLKYVEELEDHVKNLEQLHEKDHVAGAEEGAGANREFDARNCVAGATDIMLDKMMYSVSAAQILNGLGSGSTEQKAEKLNQSLKAMDQTMDLFYQHKGLSNMEGAGAKDRLPAQHLNIRYMRMFAGAFMYAGGNHIGIEWDSVTGLSTGVPVVSDENGKYISGNLFGWGFAHEIGHNINQNAYAVAEITNNYFAQLVTARDSNDSTRFKYDPNVYEKVTSGTVGRSDNQATQLAMYWQLHIAYDRAYNFKTYNSYQEQFNNLFYARVDSYARDLDRAPAPGGIKLTLEGDAEQKFMRLACAAAEKDLTEYFTRWGVVPNAGTLQYAQQFDKEERAIYYLTDDARVYEMEHGTDAKIQNQDVISESSSASVNPNVPNEVKLAINSSVSDDVILGYEVVRHTYENGKKTSEIAGFAPAAGSASVEFSDHVTTINNRVVSYEVRAVDKFGYYSNAKEIGAVRISHDGSMDKSLWTVSTNMKSADDKVIDADEKDPCDPTPEPAIKRVIDNDYADNSYVGTAASDAAVTINMNKKAAVSALKYTVGEGSSIGAYTVEISEDGSTWTKVREGSFEDKTGSQTVYFQNEKGDPWVATYDAVQVRLTAKQSAGKEITITEIDLLGPTGDSISFGTTEGDTAGAVGKLAVAYEYENGKFIPAGSMVFTGRYKGNPAYNVVLVYDEAGNIVGGTKEDGSVEAEQIILAEVPENGLLGETSDGTWIYWIEPETDGSIPEVTGNVRAELYRVDNALTNEGQRMVSDTMPLKMPETLGEIELHK